MSKMDRILNSKKDKQTIYEIYRACRLCGAGAGYKMPIIQNVVDLDDTDVELKQKIRECVQIEVHQDDKMPPLICELCVDKVNDFYEFFEMCRQTNKKTRLKLGLPPQSMPKGMPDAGECILGLTEPVYVNDDSDGEPLAKHKKLQPRAKVKREPELKVKVEKSVLSDTRSSRHKNSRRSVSPPRMTRHRKNSRDDNVSLSRLQDKSKSPKVTPKSILKKESKTEDNSLLTPRLKRSRDKEPIKSETPAKKVKIAVKTSPQTTPKTSPRMSKSPKPSGRRAPSPPRTFKCAVCAQAHKTPQAVSSHMRIHVVTFTSPKLACNPCGLWFQSPDEANSHHKHHRSKSKPYNCRRCTANFKHLSAYDEHFENKECIPWFEEPDVKCDECWHLFATNKLLRDHRCLGEDHRPGGKCGKCNRSYALLKNLRKHEQNCTAKKKGELNLDPALLAKLRPLQVRVSRCDPLLSNMYGRHYDVSDVAADFGLDENCFYPYISSSFGIKSEPDFDGMVAIKDEIKDEFCTEEDYVHWDSEESDSDAETCLVLTPLAKKKRVDTLATLTLKTIFSQRCLGKVPRKRRRVKREASVFDSLLNNDSDDKVTRDINNIIDNLGDDDELDGDEDKVDDKSQNDNEKSQGGSDKVSNGDNIIIFDDIDEKSADFDDRSSRNGVDDSNDIVSNENDAQVKATDNVKNNNVVNMDKGNDNAEKNDTAKIDQNVKDVDTVSNDQNSMQGEAPKSVLNGPTDDLCEKPTSNEEKDIKNDVSREFNNDSRLNSNKLNVIVDNDKVNNGSTNVSVDTKVENGNEHSIVNVVENKVSGVDEVESTVNKVENTGSEVESGVVERENTGKDEENTGKEEENTSKEKENNGKQEENTGKDKENTVNNAENTVNDEKSTANEEKNTGNDAVTTVNDIETKVNDENDENETESTKNDAKTDFDDCIDNSQDSNSIGTFNESLLNDNTQSDVISESEKETDKDFNAKCVSDNATSMSELNSEIDEIKNRRDYFSMENLSQDSKISDVDMNLNLDSKTNDSTLKNDSNDKNFNSVDIEKSDEKIFKSSEDMDDSKLMEALDAEIGESNDTQRPGNEANDKIALEDLITAKNTEKSIDMDILPDEFNFDA